MSLGLNTLICICLACWSTWGIFDKKALEAAKHLDVMVFQHIIYVLEIPIIFFILCQLYPIGFGIDNMTWIWSALGSGCSSSAMLFYLVAMSKAEASFVLGITASYPLVVQILAYFMLGEALVPERLFGSLLIGLGVALIGSSDHKKDEEVPIQNVPPVSLLRGQRITRVQEGRRKQVKTKVLLLCAVATLLWGITGLFDKKALLLDAPFKVYFARCVWDGAILILLIIGCRYYKYRCQWKAKEAWKWSGLSSICLSFGTMSYMFAMSMATASYIIVITGCYPLFMYLLAILFLKEKMRKSRLAGVLLVVLGGLLVQGTQAV